MTLITIWSEEIKKAKRKIDSKPVIYADDVKIPTILNYDPRMCKSQDCHTSLHLGSRKLTLTLIDFINNKIHDNYTIIYIGAADGYSIEPVIQMFPKLTWELYDTRPLMFDYTIYKNVVYYKDFFGQNHIDKYNSFKNIALFSDMRTDLSKKTNKTADKIITEDMAFQKHMLTLLCNAKKKVIPAMLKFRFPYTDSDNNKTIKYNYLDGELKLEPWNGVNSAECRLIVNDKLTLKDYHLSEYENRFMYINFIYREFQSYKTSPGTMINNDDSLLYRAVLGGDECFDCALEEEILSQFFTNKNNLTSNFYKLSMIELRNYISRLNQHLNLLPMYNQRFNLDTKKWEQGQYRTNKFIQTIHNYHGKLPDKNRDYHILLKIIEPIDIVYNNIIKYANISSNYNDIILETIKKKKCLDYLYKCITHKSMDMVNNYELDEAIGDKILNMLIILWLRNTFKFEDVAGLTRLSDAFHSGTFMIHHFARLLQLDKIIIIENEINEIKNKQPLEDVVESFFSYILFLFETIISENNNMKSIGLPIDIIYNMVASIMQDVNIKEMRNLIFPPVTTLKELYTKEFGKDGTKYFKTFKVYNSDTSNEINKTVRDDELGDYTIKIDYKNQILKYRAFGPYNIVRTDGANVFLDRIRQVDNKTKLNLDGFDYKLPERK